MSHQDPYVSTETLRQLCQPTSSTRQTKNSREDAALDAELDALRAARAEAIREDAELDAELATIRDDAKRIGMLLVNIPLWKLTVFFFRVFLAIFFASIIYVVWWFLVSALLAANGLVIGTLIANLSHPF